MVNNIILKTLKNEACVAHLQGGLRAIKNLGSPVEIVPNLIHNQPLSFNIPNNSYKISDFIEELKNLNLEVVGIDYYNNNIEQLEQNYPPRWLSLSRINGANNPSVWGNLCVKAHTLQDYYLADIASRISFGLTACETRLHDLSESYYKELDTECKYSRFENGSKYRSLNTFNIYLALHSFFMESCLLRDYLAEFMHIYIFNKSGNKPITTMGSLIEKVLNKLNSPDDFASEIIQITNKESADGWLAKLGAYRDLVVHSTPIEQVRSSSFIIQKTININNSHTLPSIELPLPNDPIYICKKRTDLTKNICTGSNPSFEDWYMAVQEDTDMNEIAIDALKYCSLAHDKLIELAINTFNQYQNLSGISGS
ncbi:hypothetical protein [Anabaena sp. PCC 7108]|uniref:hypothetical protein n=1 Tax=Anabaena sp. PCC 7108 TaxID=163908 RepID=UPI00034D02B4|nr:hypothetical protein [Anabaena sp. PCC 7108]